MAQKNSHKKQLSFNDYKTMKDEIIEISELRFENILTKRLKTFKTEFKKELMDELNPRFNSLEKRLTFLTWFLPVLITLLLTVFQVIK